MLAGIGAAHGTRGEVRVKSFTSNPLALRDYAPLTTDSGRVLEIERLRPSKDVLVVKFRGIDDRNAAEELKGATLSVARSDLPAPDPEEFYLADLIGLRALDADGQSLGTVASVENYGAGDVIEIARDAGPPLLLPFTKACVPAIDIAAGHLTIVPPAEIEIKETDASPNTEEEA